MRHMKMSLEIVIIIVEGRFWISRVVALRIPRCESRATGAGASRAHLEREPRTGSPRTALLGKVENHFHALFTTIIQIIFVWYLLLLQANKMSDLIPVCNLVKIKVNRLILTWFYNYVQGNISNHHKVIILTINEQSQVLKRIAHWGARTNLLKLFCNRKNPINLFCFLWNA